MKQKIVNWSILLLLTLCWMPVKSWAYSSVTVPIHDPVYRELDKLAAHGLIKTMLKGQRPYVRAEIGRLIAEAMKNYPEFEDKYRREELSVAESEKRLSAKVYVDRILARLKFQYKEELIQREAIPGKVPTFQGQPLEYIRADYLYLGENRGVINPDNGLGGINAFIQPLVEDREGRHYQRGHNWAFETQHWGRMGKYFSMQVQPRFQMQIAKSPRQSETEVFIHRLNGRFTYDKLDLEIGRDSLNWGPGATGGLMFSANPRPLDMIKISSISPFYYPFFFSKIGINQMSFAAINLGPEQNFKNPWLFVHKISNKGHDFLEFGFTQFFEIGGEGAPSVSFGRGFIDYFDLSQNEERDKHAMSIELIGHIQAARGMEVYTEIRFDDFTSNMETLWNYNNSYLAGVYLPRLNNTGTLDLRVEYRRLGARYSRSMLFTDGSTENRLLLGDPLGPDAYAISAQVGYDFNPRNFFSFGFQFSHRNNNQYVIQDSSVTKVMDLGNEDRFRYQLSWRRLFNSHMVGWAGLGIDHVLDQNFAEGNDKVNLLGEIGFQVYLSPHYQSHIFH